MMQTVYFFKVKLVEIFEQKKKNLHITYKMNKKFLPL